MSVYKRKDRNGKVTGWRAVVRMKGYPTACKEFQENKKPMIGKKIPVDKLKLANCNLKGIKFSAHLLI